MWIDGHRRAASCDADTIGIFFHGLWIISTCPIHWQPKKPIKSVMYLTRATFTRKHGFEAKADKNTSIFASMTRFSGGVHVYIPVVILSKDNDGELVREGKGVDRQIRE